jgi:hypothetical protein
MLSPRDKQSLVARGVAQAHRLELWANLLETAARSDA